VGQEVAIFFDGRLFVERLVVLVCNQLPK